MARRSPLRLAASLAATGPALAPAGAAAAVPGHGGMVSLERQRVF